MLDAPPGWVADAVFYQIFPDRFARSPRVELPGAVEPWEAPPTRHGFKGGNLPGITDRLGYLEDLGITGIYLNPIFTSASNHRYHTYDYLRVDPLLGGDGALRELLDAAHARGMRVILDGVFNHTGRGFLPFHHVLEAGRHSPYRDWFYLDLPAIEAGRQLRAYAEEQLDQPATDGGDSLARLGYRSWWDLPALPKLNVTNPAVRDYLLEVAEHWTRFGIDGWRLDVPDEIEDPAFWPQFRRRVRAINPDAYLVGELWTERQDYVSGERFDGLMNYPLLYALVGYAAGDRLDRAAFASHDTLSRHLHALDGPGLGAALTALSTTYSPQVTGAQLNLLGSHDTPRLRALCGGDLASAQLAMLLLMTLPGAPCIYYGDEIGLSGGMDPDNRGAFPDEAAWDRGLLSHVRWLVALRHANPVLRHGELTIVAADGPTCGFLRADRPDADDGPGACVLVAVNNGDESAVSRFRLSQLTGRQFEALVPPGGDARGSIRVTSDEITIEIPRRAGVVYRSTHDATLSG